MKREGSSTWLKILVGFLEISGRHGLLGGSGRKLKTSSETDLKQKSKLMVLDET